MNTTDSLSKIEFNNNSNNKFNTLNNNNTFISSFNSDEIFNYIDIDKNGYITIDELYKHIINNMT